MRKGCTERCTPFLFRLESSDFRSIHLMSRRCHQSIHQSWIRSIRSSFLNDCRCSSHSSRSFHLSCSVIHSAIRAVSCRCFPIPNYQRVRNSRRDFHRRSRCRLKFHARLIRCCFRSIRWSFQGRRWICSIPIRTVSRCPAEIRFLSASHCSSFRNHSFRLNSMSVMILSHSGCSCRSPYILPPCSGALITQQHLCEALPSLRDEKSKSYAISVFFARSYGTVLQTVFVSEHNSHRE